MSDIPVDAMFKLTEPPRMWLRSYILATKDYLKEMWRTLCDMVSPSVAPVGLQAVNSSLDIAGRQERILVSDCLTFVCVRIRK